MGNELKDYPYLHNCVHCGTVVGCESLISRGEMTVHYGTCGHTVALTYGTEVFEGV